MPKLTKRIVDAAKPGPLAKKGKRKGLPTDRWVWDSDVKGFGLRVTPAGIKSYVITYRTVGGRKRKFTLGQHGVLTPSRARDLAKERLREVKQGGDPAGERKRLRNAPTLSELADDYTKRHLKPKCKPSTVAEWTRLLKKEILPQLGALKVADVTRVDVSALHRKLEAKPVTANHVVRVLSAMLNYAEKEGLRPDGSNPCRHVSKYPERKRERYLSSAELTRLGEALTKAEKGRKAHPSGILALRLLLLTGARKGEILGLTWREVDFERRCLRLSDSKTGRKLIPLGAPSLELLQRAPRQKGNPHVCFGEKAGEPLRNLQDIWKRVKTAAGIEDVRIHDLRHSHASMGAGLGLSLPLIGKLLGHSSTATTARYAHLAADPVQEAAERVSSGIAAALEGAKRPTAARV